MDLAKVCISSGSACTSGKPLPSHVLLAHGCTDKEARQTVRLSLTAEVADVEFEIACSALVKNINMMQNYNS